MLESGENYLEAVLMLEKKNGTVRSIDVANELCVTKASVSRAMSILRGEAYIAFAQDNSIIFTAKGRQKAEAVYERHSIITQFFMRTLGVSETVANKDACRFEHDISDEMFAAIKKFIHA